MRHTPLFWIRLWLAIFIAGLVTSGITAIPLITQLNIVYRALHYFGITGGEFHDWIQQVYAGLLETRARYPFLFYGTDWLAFGHFVVAIAFIGPLRDPRRNIWVIQSGMLACVAVIPYAVVFGAIRGIPWWWLLIDCSFGLFGLVSLAIAYRLARRLSPES